ncbi:PIN domain-containing protein [Halovenus marina]|uniref:PIN domain-containing protein n=1 Tax=Halovenus marina TaxID=3396621 RepID=UPI003F57BCFA
MLVFDNNLLSDYLDGVDTARHFLQQHEQRVWAIPSIVLYEAYMGSIHGYIDGTPSTLRQAVTASMEVLPVTERTADEAASLQEELLSAGVAADHPDALIAASAREHGGTFATAEKHFWDDRVQSVVPVAEYDPY